MNLFGKGKMREDLTVNMNGESENSHWRVPVAVYKDVEPVRQKNNGDRDQNVVCQKWLKRRYGDPSGEPIVQPYGSTARHTYN